MRRLHAAAPPAAEEGGDGAGGSSTRCSPGDDALAGQRRGSSPSRRTASSSASRRRPSTTSAPTRSTSSTRRPLRFLAAGPPARRRRDRPGDRGLRRVLPRRGAAGPGRGAAPVAVPRRAAARPEPALPARAPHGPLHAALPALLHRAADRRRTCRSRTILRLADEFAALQGLRFIVSGGEPLMHRHFWQLNERLPALPLPLDPADQRHPARPRGGARAALPRGAGQPRRPAGRPRPAARPGELPPRDRARCATWPRRGSPISVASVVFAGNLERFDELEAILEEFPLRGWSIDVPCPAGAHGRQPRPAPRPGAGRRAHGALVRRRLLRLERRTGPAARTWPPSWRTARSTSAATSPTGAPARCREGLAAAWARLPRWRLEELSCRCSHLAECRGGCRFRAQAHGSDLGPDPAMCHLRGVPVGGDLRET